MYCCQIWSQYKKHPVRQLQVGYNHAFRIIMKYDRTYSASGMFVENNVMSFNDILAETFCTILNNVLHKVTILLLTTYTILPEPRQQSGRTLIVQ